MKIELSNKTFQILSERCSVINAYPFIYNELLKPWKPCRKSGCPEVTRYESGYCQSHEYLAHEAQKKYNKRRGSAHSRGYDEKWKKLSKAKLAHDPLCEKCSTTDNPVSAVLVHHIKPIEDFPELRLEWSNLESNCRECHEKQHGRL